MDFTAGRFFYYFSWSFWSLFYDLDFSFSSIGEFIVCCSCLDFVFLQAAAKSCSMYFLCPGMKMDSFVETANNIMEDTMPLR